MNEAVKLIASVLRNKYVWIGITVLIIYFVVRRNIYALNKTFASRSVDYQRDSDGKPIVVNEERKAQLRDLAKQINVDIQGVNWSLRVPESIVTASKLSDPELVYLSQHYKQYVTRGVSLYEDINSEVYTMDAKADDLILATLKKIGEY